MLLVPNDGWADMYTTTNKLRSENMLLWDSSEDFVILIIFVIW